MEFNFNRYFKYSDLESGEKNDFLSIEKSENYQKILKADNLYVIYASNYIEMRDRFDYVIENGNPINDYFVGKLVEVVEYYLSTPFRVQSTDGGIIECNEIYILDEDFINGKKSNATEESAMKFDESKIIDITSPNINGYLGKRVLGAFSVDGIRDYFQSVNSDRVVFKGELIEFRYNKFFPFKIHLEDEDDTTHVSVIYPLEDIETETKQDTPNKIKRLVIERDKDKVVVLLLPNKDGKGYQYINLTKGHICPCVFPTMEDALKDLENFKSLGKIKSWIEIPDKEKLEI